MMDELDMMLREIREINSAAAGGSGKFSQMRLAFTNCGVENDRLILHRRWLVIGSYDSSVSDFIELELRFVGIGNDQRRVFGQHM